MDYFTYTALKQGIPTDVETASCREFTHDIGVYEREQRREPRSEHTANVLLRRQAGVSL